ncbi:Hypothetical Protein FCC1311_060292 [Hondaea fermentalgiana]|uniref:Uncharacterized protein n=1 Tax=Hondaea fermentalgiana TaxID=2315210 RepID=A0A2R5GHJ3_9STRA|nr:Hypothetical Protein FCC1311_060292 [Hondaea fermentalgiana]|eukprot:GBG29809.1 Hypothetical Protein FCC1311_060292 [Hondaea fermentalgiana]
MTRDENVRSSDLIDMLCQHIVSHSRDAFLVGSTEELMGVDSSINFDSPRVRAAILAAGNVALTKHLLSSGRVRPTPFFEDRRAPFRLMEQHEVPVWMEILRASSPDCLAAMPSAFAIGSLARLASWDEWPCFRELAIRSTPVASEVTEAFDPRVPCSHEIPVAQPVDDALPPPLTPPIGGWWPFLHSLTPSETERIRIGASAHLADAHPSFADQLTPAQRETLLRAHLRRPLPRPVDALLVGWDAPPELVREVMHHGKLTDEQLARVVDACALCDRATEHRLRNGTILTVREAKPEFRSDAIKVDRDSHINVVFYG